MSYLEWSFDEDIGIEPATPLGRIAINGEEGSLIEDNLTLDTFLEAMIEGLALLVTEDDASVDTIDEPHPLVLHRVGEGVRLSFGNKTTEVRDRGALSRELVGVVGELLGKLDDAARALGQDPVGYEKLRTFLKTSEGT